MLSSNCLLAAHLLLLPQGVFLVDVAIVFVFPVYLLRQMRREWGVLISHFCSLKEYSSCKVDMMWQP